MSTELWKPKRQRSPNYPNYSLRECIAFLTKYYAKNKASETHFDEAVISIGHSPSSSTANRAIAAMIAFGLFEFRGSGNAKFYKASKLAQTYMLSTDDDEKAQLLKKAALTDESMKDVWDKWGANIPQEQSIQKSLQLEMSYSPEGAKNFAKVIIDTYEFAHLNEAIVDGNNEEESPNRDEQKQIRIDGTAKKATADSSIRTANLLLIGKDRQVVISVPNDFSEDEFSRMLKWLEIQKEGLVVEVAF